MAHTPLRPQLDPQAPRGMEHRRLPRGRHLPPTHRTCQAHTVCTRLRQWMPSRSLRRRVRPLQRRSHRRGPVGSQGTRCWSCHSPGRCLCTGRRHKRERRWNCTPARTCCPRGPAARCQGKLDTVTGPWLLAHRRRCSLGTPCTRRFSLRTRSDPWGRWCRLPSQGWQRSQAGKASTWLERAHLAGCGPCLKGGCNRVSASM